MTTDLSRYGTNELRQAVELLEAFANSGCEFLGDGLTLNFNEDSGKVFLSDEDFNVAVYEGGRLVQFYSCPNCGNEGTQEFGIGEGWNFEANDGYCSKECVARSNE